MFIHVTATFNGIILSVVVFAHLGRYDLASVMLIPPFLFSGRYSIPGHQYRPVPYHAIQIALSQDHTRTLFLALC